MTSIPGIDPSVPPSGTGCVECDATGGWWVHLRRCTQCGHIGCCDTSPAQHASAHAAGTGHPELMQRYSKLADVSKICRSESVPVVPIGRTSRVHSLHRRLGAEIIAQVVA